MADQPIDYDALAKAHGAISSAPDYDALAKANGAIGSTPPAKTGFWGRVGQNLNPLPAAKAIWNDPVGTVKNLVTPNPEIAQEASDAFNKGNYGRYALSQAEDIPFFGPVIRQAEQDVKNKDWGALGGTAVTMALPKLLGKVRGAIPLRNNLNAVERSAVNAGAAAGVPIDVGTATGNEFVRAAQGTVGKLPGTAGRAASLAEKGEQGLTKWGQDVARSTAPAGVADKVIAGENVASETARRVEQQAALADQHYERLRQIAAQNKRPVTVGTKQVPGPNPQASMTPAGMPQTVPNVQQLELPTAYQNMKAQVAPVIAQMEKVLDEGQRQASPGYKVLKQIAERPDYTDINTAIQDLSAIQNIARTPMGELPQVQGISRGMAKSVIPVFRREIDNAAAAGGPDAINALDAGRAATRAKYQADRTFKALPRNSTGGIEGARVTDRLAAPGDTSLDLLRKAAQTSPNAIPSIGRSVITEIVDDMTSQGDIRRARSAVRKWNAIGDQTKAILFPNPAVRQNVTDFVNLAEMMTRRANPSGSATTGAAILSALHPKMLAMQLLAGKPVTDLLFGGNGAQMANSGIPFKMPRIIPGMAGGTVGYNVTMPPPYKEPDQQ